MTRFVSAEYAEAWKYTGFLYMAASFSALSSFLGIGYQISKETHRSFVSTVFAACVNILVNLVTIRRWGLQAASLSACLAYMLLFAVRIRHTKRYFRLRAVWPEFIGLNVACVGMIAANLAAQTIHLTVFLVVLGGIVMTACNRAIIADLCRKCVLKAAGIKERR